MVVSSAVFAFVLVWFLNPGVFLEVIVLFVMMGNISL